MISKRRTPILAILFAADLACFALGGLGYGTPWEMAGVAGLVVFLVLFEVL